MGEGEVCVAMAGGGLSSEMESEKTKQKRDHDWVTDGSDVEPVAKKQAKEGEVARSELEVVTVCVEGEASGKKLITEEEVDNSRLNESVEGRMCERVENLEREDVGFSGEKQGLNEMELEDHERMKTTADRGDIELEPCIERPVKKCASEMETEALNVSKLEPSVLQTVKEYPSDMEAGSCGKMELDPSGEKHSSEVLNDMELEPIVEQPVKDCLIDMKLEPSIGQPVKECESEMEMEACVKTQQTGALNASKPEVSVQQPVKECLSEKHLSEGLNDMEIEPIVDQPVKDCLNEMEADRGDIELEPCIEQPVKECRGEMETEALSMRKPEPVKECVSDMGAGSCGKMESTEAFKESEPVSSVQRPVSEAQSEACVKMESAEALDETEPKPSVLQPVTECTHEMEFDNLIDTNVEFSVDLSIKECKHETLIEPCIKKEASNDDICSEVLNPVVSPRDNSSFQTVNSQPDEKLVIQNQVICGEITSGRSGNSSSEGCSSQEEKGTELTSHVVIEAPKDAITSSGVRKITFKFSKRKEDFDSQPSASVVNVACNDFVNGVQKIPRLTRISEQGFHERRDSRVCPTSMEAMPVPGNTFTSVQKLLSTGILDGAKVKYISTSAELIGIVKDGGYLCGCDACNFSNVVRAHEFEEHAGGRKTSHPNKHIYMENGKSIYRIIQVIKKSPPLSRVDEVIRDVAGSAVNEELLQVWKASLQSNTDMAKTDNSHLTKLMELYHPQTRPKSYASSVAVETKPSAEGGHKKRKSRLYYDRDNDLHRLLFMPNGIPDGTALGYYARGDKVLDGYKQGIGIVCSHCDDKISPSQFEAHAGWAVKRQPYRNVYVIPIGMSLHDIALSLANGQSITTSNSDDMCAVCGDGGKLIICDRCPRAFHSDCLELEGLSSEDGQCQYCRDSIGSGRKAAAAESRPIVIRLSRVVKAREYEAGGCVICRVPDFSVAEFDDRTVMLCDQCEKEYHVGCLRESGRCDLKALPLDKWFCCDHCDMIHGAVQGVVSNGAAVVSGSVLGIINKKQIEKGLINGVPNEIRWRMLGGTSRYPEHLPLLSRAAAIFRECFDPIVAKSGRDLIPVMVYGRNISGQDFGGIYCVVLMVGSVVVSAGLLRIFGREVAELPLVATTRQHQGKGFFQALFFCIEELLLSLGVELLVLPAAEEAESIWTKKLGFRKMSDERYTQYSRDIQLTIFKGTSMLEKELRRTT